MSQRLRIVAFAVAAAGLAVASVGSAQPLATAESYGGGPDTSKPSCAEVRLMCTEVANPKEVFGNTYVGHDEPATSFYSSVAGSGNNTQYQLKLPTDPTGAYSDGNSYNFQLHPAFWFGMAMCDTQSYPEQLKTCTPDSDSNIVDPASGKKSAGAAFEELQFYPPGWVPQFANSSCDATRWCVALNIDSLSEDPFEGTVQNSTCASQVLGGLEYVNFAYLTLDGKPIGPPNPLQFDVSGSGDPTVANPKHGDVFFANSGDNLSVSLHDSPSGLVTTVTDNTTGAVGTMTASAANHFGQMKYEPHGTKCQEIDYNFHPMYSTSSPATRVLWAAHTYNVAYSDEIGHFDFCSHLDANQGFNCDGNEGPPGSQQPADGDDYGCFPSESSLNYPATGCVATNDPGFDGAPYYAGRWPNGSNSSSAPSPIIFSSARSGSSTYSQVAYETDLPRIEAPDLGGTCNRNTGAGCVNPPVNDRGTNAFYPYFSQVTTSFGGPSTCAFGEGDLGGAYTSSAQEFGTTPLFINYYAFGGEGKSLSRTNDFRNIVPNPCP